MSAPMTPSPAGGVTVQPTSHRGVLDIVTTKAPDPDTGDLAALIGGVVCAVLLLLICLIAVLLWCLSRNKGSYVTNEMDEDDAVGEDEESESSDAALQSKEPLRTTEEEE